MSDKVRSLRCSICGTNWPDEPDYKTCCECGADCWVDPHEPIPADEAKSRKVRAEFERYCDARDAASA